MTDTNYTFTPDEIEQARLIQKRQNEQNTKRQADIRNALAEEEERKERKERKERNIHLFLFIVVIVVIGIILLIVYFSGGFTDNMTVSPNERYPIEYYRYHQPYYSS